MVLCFHKISAHKLKTTQFSEQPQWQAVLLFFLYEDIKDINVREKKVYSHLRQKLFLPPVHENKEVGVNTPADFLTC